MSRRELPFDPIEVAREDWGERGWKAAANGMATVTGVMRVQQIFVSQADEILRPFQLTFARWEVLVLLAFSRNQTLAVGKISERLQVHPSSITNSIKRLEASRLVTKNVDPEDGRGIIVQITTRGNAAVKRSTVDLNDMLFERIGLKSSEFEQLFNCLRKIRYEAGDFVV